MGAFCLASPAAAGLFPWSQGEKSSGYTATQYPIVLVHGLFGFDSAAGIDYWFDIVENLQKDGANVYVTSVSAANSPTVRGEQLLAQVEEITAEAGVRKVNLIGHSQGGFTVRYVASVRPDLVASITTVGTPHKGSPVADVVDGVTAAVPPVRDGVATAVDAFGTVISVLSGHPFNPQNSLGALDVLTTQGAARFNRTYATAALPAGCGNGAAEVNGTPYYSWSGVVRIPTNIVDPTSTALLATGALISEPNDGLVGRCSSHFGTVIRDNYRLDHLDEVNQILGLTPPLGTDPVSLFRQQANRLKNAGI
ncbi:triacylglycerol lipase [Salinisphaera sp. Q1T1-3]|nr:triacylglycerol lipase [Salinisphaera sp. Q1T1-3]